MEKMGLFFKQWKNIYPLMDQKFINPLKEVKKKVMKTYITDGNVDRAKSVFAGAVLTGIFSVLMNTPASEDMKRKSELMSFKKAIEKYVEKADQAVEKADQAVEKAQETMEKAQEAVDKAQLAVDKAQLAVDKLDKKLD